MLQTLDHLWKDHLLQMDHLKEGISLRSYGQKDPLLEYKREGFSLFRDMMNRFAADVVEKCFRVQVTSEESVEKAQAAEMGAPAPTAISHGEINAFAQNAPREARGDSGDQRVATIKRTGEKVGRNDPCPCGSGKKYKKCCGK